MTDRDTSQIGQPSTPTSSQSRDRVVKFRFERIGPVDDAELELGDLTIIAGRNNTGKTYLVYTLYGFLKLSRRSPRFFLEPDEDSTPHDVRLFEMTKELMATGQMRRHLSRGAFIQERREVIKQLAQAFSEHSLSGVFSQRRAFEEATIDVQVSNWIPRRSEILQLSGGGDPGILLRYEDEYLFASIDNTDMSPDNFGQLHSVLSELSDLYLELLLPEIPSDPFVMSAERFGISLFYKELDFARNSLVDMLQKMGDERDREAFSPYVLIDRTSSRYALPIRDNINFTRGIPDLKENYVPTRDDLPTRIVSMMGGHYRSDEDDIRFASSEGSQRKFDIPLYTASSSARGLSDLFFFLQHSSREGQLLIIDEPESHLDTTNQMLMARLLARVVQVGIRVLITTHSDYLIKELNNLIMLSNSFENRDTVTKQLGYESDEFLNPSSVRAYVAEENGLVRCDVDQFGIDMPVFDKSIDRINDVANELVIRLETNA